MDEELDLFEKLEAFLNRKEAIAASLLPQASIPYGLAETAVGVRNISPSQIGSGLVGLIPLLGQIKKAEKLRRFKTAMGSMYDVTPTGTTIRNKARRPAHGDDFGMKPESAETFYVDDTNLHRLGEIQARGEPTRIVQVAPDQYAVQFLEPSRYAGKVSERTVADVIREPRVGLYPVELFASPARVKDRVLPRQGSSGVHFGNQIIEILDQ